MWRLAGCVLALAACDAVTTGDDAAVDCPRIELSSEPSSSTFSVARACDVAIVAEGDRVVELWTDGAELRLDGGPATEHVGPLRLSAGTHDLGIGGPATLHVRDHGAPAGEILVGRSLTWTDGALLDDRASVGLARLLQSVSSEPGRTLAAWFARFATTAHSERLGPQRLLDAFAAEHGSDPGAWDLDALPFVATGVHNRIDLADGTHCGELRVSFASTDPLHRPFHLIFLFRQPPAADDVRPDGSAHCAATALRWARLSENTDGAFLDAARAWVDDALRPERLIVIETLEFIISPWEWRQWFVVDGALENRPLFQTVDSARLNAPGADRDAFLAWVAANEAALASRRLEIPEVFRSPSARVNDGVPWVPLELPPSAEHPSLRQQIEIVGCPACHAIDAGFVQTRPDRTFSPFYEKELVARAAHLSALGEGAAEPPPFGPLQPDPVLPP